MVPKMSSAIIPEGFVACEAALPVQFHDIWHSTRFITSERALAQAVLWQAVIDLQKYRFAPRRRGQRMYMEAYQWVASGDRSWPFSFANLCEMLILDPEPVRAQLLNAAAPPAAAPADAAHEVEQAA